MADDYLQRLRNTGRNDECPCGSGRKYKKCHLGEDSEKERLSLEKTAADAKKNAVAGGKQVDNKPTHPEIKHGRDGQLIRPHGPVSVARQINAPRKAGP
jgi:hypothetical protein